MNKGEKARKEIQLTIDELGLIKTDSKIILENASPNYMKDIIKLATDVFTNEQNIPKNLIPLNENLQPIWWCARMGEDIIGISL